MPNEPTAPASRLCLAAILLVLGPMPGAAAEGQPPYQPGEASSPSSGSYFTLPVPGGSGTPSGAPIVSGEGLSLLDRLGSTVPYAGERTGTVAGVQTLLRAEGTLTLTDNVGLDPGATERSDLVAELRIPIALRRTGSRVRFDFAYAPTAYVYARSDDDNDIRHKLDALVSAEVAENFFFVEAAANVDDSFISAFAPRPESGTSITDNRTQQTTLRLSPYVAKRTTRDWDYLVRNDTYWNRYADDALDESLVNRVSLGLRAPPARLRTEADYTYLYTKFESQPDGFYQQVGRVRPVLSVTRRLKVGARVGYESNDYGLSSYSGAVYGGELAWAPSPRTNLNGFLEHRFFGASYGLGFSHRSRRTLWRLSGTRDTYTSVDQPLTLRPGNTADALDDTLRSRIPDSAERARAVQQFLAAAGLPSSTARYYTFYANQIYLAEQWTASVALLGRRNTVELGVFWQDNEPISGNGVSLPLALVDANRLRQKGARAVVSHRLSALSAVTFTASRQYSSSSGTSAAGSFDSTEDTLRLVLGHRLGQRTDASIGLRWVNSSGTISYEEHALFGTLAHTF